MPKKEEIIWSNRFVCGNLEIDDYHKEIIDGVVELYKMLDDSAKYKSEIPELTKKIEEAMYEHMDIEINYLKRFNLPGWVAHEESHHYYKKELEFYKNYALPDVIRAVMTGEISREYMRKHFFQFDVRDIRLINEKLNELEENE